MSSSVVGSSISGYVTALDEKSLTLSRDGGPPIALPVASITSLQMVTGSRRATVKGLWLGAAIGGVLGLAAKVDPDYCGGDTGNLCSRGEAIGASALGGAVIGTVIGVLIKSDRWAPVTLNAFRPNARARRSPGLQVAVAFRF